MMDQATYDQAAEKIRAGNVAYVNGRGAASLSELDFIREVEAVPPPPPKQTGPLVTVRDFAGEDVTEFLSVLGQLAAVRDQVASLYAGVADRDVEEPAAREALGKIYQLVAPYAPPPTFMPPPLPSGSSVNDLFRTGSLMLRALDRVERSCAQAEEARQAAVAAAEEEKRQAAAQAARDREEGARIKRLLSLAEK